MTLPVGNIVNTLATGGTSTNVFIPVFMNRNPTTTDLGYQPTQRWINTVTFDEWILYNIPADIHSLPKNVTGIGTLGNNSVNNRVGYAHLELSMS